MDSAAPAVPATIASEYDSPAWASMWISWTNSPGAYQPHGEAGVRMTAGSDSPWGWYAPGEFVHEIHMLAQAGLSYADAVVAGTAGAAESIGVGTLAGRLARERPADALVVRGDPTRDITALWDVLDVYQAGRRVERGVA